MDDKDDERGEPGFRRDVRKAAEKATRIDANRELGGVRLGKFRAIATQSSQITREM